MKTNKQTWETGIKILKAAGLVLAVYLGMRFALPVILPFLAAFFFARLLHPAVLWLEKKIRCRKRELLCMAVYFFFLVCIGAILILITWACVKLGGMCVRNADNIYQKAQEIFCDCCKRVEMFTGIRTDAIELTLRDKMNTMPKEAVGISASFGKKALGFLAAAFVAIISTLLILIDYEKLVSKLGETKPGRAVKSFFLQIKQAGFAYIKAQLIIMSLVGLACIIGLFLTGNPYAVLLGILISICDALPILGTGTVFVPWMIISIVYGSYGKAAAYLMIYLFCSFLRQLLEPRLVGTRLGVHPLAVLASIYIGVHVYGGAGVILGPASALVLWELWKMQDI